MPRTNQRRTETALEILDREIEFVSRERTAFRRFTSRIENLAPEQPATRPGSSGGGVIALTGATEESTGSIQLQTVREAYTETVMSVPHYEREYGESLQANMAAELGTEVARQVVDGQQLTPMLHETLVAASERGLTERRQFVEILREEQRSLTTIQSQLDELESRAADIRRAIEDDTREASLSDCDDELTALEATCSDLAEERQQLLHRRSAARLSGIDAESLVRFLYTDCEATCPALADITDCIETIRAHRKRCLR